MQKIVPNAMMILIGSLLVVNVFVLMDMSSHNLEMYVLKKQMYLWLSFLQLEVLYV